MSIKLNEKYFVEGASEVTLVHGPDINGCYCCVRSNGSFCIVSGDKLTTMDDKEISKMSQALFISTDYEQNECNDIARTLVTEYNYRKCESVTKNELYEVLDKKIDPQTPWVDAVAILHDLGYAKLKKLD